MVRDQIYFVLSNRLCRFQVQNRDFVVAVAVKIHQLPRTAIAEVVAETTAKFFDVSSVVLPCRGSAVRGRSRGGIQLPRSRVW